MQKAMFGAGCFWGVQAAFKKLKGIHTTATGYAGGKTVNPTYKDVCSGETGHAEVVLIEFDPGLIFYEELLKTFWECHDPTSYHRQGFDFGEQYRSIIFYFSQEQKETALKVKQDLQKSDQFTRDIVTEIMPAGEFYRAEEYHQDYFEKRGQNSCEL